jgi:hypothetical protein
MVDLSVWANAVDGNLMNTGDAPALEPVRVTLVVEPAEPDAGVDAGRLDAGADAGHPGDASHAGDAALDGGAAGDTDAAVVLDASADASMRRRAMRSATLGCPTRAARRPLRSRESAAGSSAGGGRGR